MPALHDTLLLSSALQTTPEEQRNRERGLIHKASMGEIHLHVSTLRGQLLSLGCFQTALAQGGAQIWRRQTGGRAVAAGDGFLVITLALPDRSILGESLRPEQILNRGVRGLLHWLRSGGLDPVYPGLDFVTLQGSRVAHLGFAQETGGELLIQVILGQTTSLAETMLRLDRLDPEGVIPSTFWSPEESTTLDRLGVTTESLRSASEVLGPLGNAYADLLELGVGVCSAASLSRAGQDAPVQPPARPLPGRTRVQVEGRLGPVLASIRLQGGNFDSLSLEGDFLAPADFPEALATSLRGQTATTDAIRTITTELFEQRGFYALGMDLDLLQTLLERALEAAS